jgi:hypothetical protein
LNIPSYLEIFNPDGSLNASIPFTQNITTFYSPQIGGFRTLSQNPFVAGIGVVNEYGIVKQWVGGFRTCFIDDLGLGFPVYGRSNSLDFGLQVVEYVNPADPSQRIATIVLDKLPGGVERFSLVIYGANGFAAQSLRYVTGPRLPISACVGMANNNPEAFE